MLFIFHKSYVNTTPNFPRIFLAVRRNQVLGAMAPNQEGVALLMSKIWEPREGGRGRGRRWRKQTCRLTALPEAGSSPETGSE